MRTILALVAIVCVPIAAAAGYAAHRDPAPPPFGQYLLEQQNVKHVTGQDADEWLAVAVTGPNKGGSVDVFTALASYPTHGDLERSAQGKVVYVEMKCENYATGGTKNLYAAENVVRKCTSERRTRKEAEAYMRSLLQAEPKS